MHAGHCDGVRGRLYGVYSVATVINRSLLSSLISSTVKEAAKSLDHADNVVAYVF